MPLFLLGVIAGLGGCNDDDEKVGTDEDEDFVVKEEYTDRLLNARTVSAEGGDFYWTLEASDEWELSEKADWLSVDPMEGKAGKTGLVLKIDKVKGVQTGEKRTADLTVLVGDKVFTYVISQSTTDLEEEKAYCRFADSKIFSIEGGTLERMLEASGDWSVEVPAGSWLTFEPKSGKGGQTPVTMTATPIENGLMRSELLTFTVDGEKLYVTAGQNLNVSVPTLTLPEESVAVSGRLAAMTGHCSFKNDEVDIEEIGFVLRKQGESEWSRTAVSEVQDLAEYDFTAEIGSLTMGCTWEYAPYAVTDGTRHVSKEIGTFYVESTVINGVWFYENFDGLYNAETGEYYVTAPYSSYNEITGESIACIDGESRSVFIRQGQPQAKYEIPKPVGNGGWAYRSINLRKQNGSGWLSAKIYPDDFSESAYNSVSKGTEMYEGASGNWKLNADYSGDWILNISGLDFTDAGTCELSFGFATQSNATSMMAKEGILKVYVSETGAEGDWKELKWTYTPSLVFAYQYYKFITTEQFEADNIKYIRILINENNVGGASTTYSLDDIKVTAVE